MGTYYVGIGGDYETWASVSWSSGNTYDGMGQRFTESVSIGANSVVVQNCLVDAQGVRDRCVLAYNRSNVQIRDVIGINSTDSTFQVSPAGVNNIIVRCSAYNFSGSGVYAYGQTNLQIQRCVCSSLVGAFNTGIYVDGACTGGSIESCKIYDLMGDGIMLRAGSSSVLVSGNFLYGRIKDAIALEDAQTCQVLHNTVRHDNFYGAAYPALKLGNDFDTGSASGGNTIKNNIFLSPAASLGVVQCYKIGGSNIFDGNIYSPSAIFAWNTTNDTIARDNYTFAEFQALGKYELNGKLTLHSITDTGIPTGVLPPGSVALIGIRDLNWNVFSATSPTPGAVEVSPRLRLRKQ